MKYLYLYYLIPVSLLILLIYREISWNKYYNQIIKEHSEKENELIINLRTTLNQIKYLETNCYNYNNLTIDFDNYNNSCIDYPNNCFNDTINEGIIIIERFIEPQMKIFDLNGLLQICLYIIIMMYEIFFSYINPTIESICKHKRFNSTIYQLKIYLLRYLPRSNILFFTFIVIKAIYIWFGFYISNRQLHTQSLVKSILLWYFSLIFVILSSNFIQSYRYIRYKLFDIEFHKWLISILLCLDTSHNFTWTYLLLISRLPLIWPLRYYFYYNTVSYQTNQLVDIFILNIIIVISLSFIFANYILLFMLVKSNTKQSDLFNTMLSLLFILLSALVVINILRVFWFIILSNGCITWYSVFITLLHIVNIVLNCIPTIYVMDIYASRSELIKSNKSEFIESNINKLKEYNQSSDKDIDIDNFKIQTEFFYDNIIEKCTMMLIFDSQSIKSFIEANKGKDDSTDSLLTNNLYKTAFTLTSYYIYKSHEENDNEEKDNEEKNTETESEIKVSHDNDTNSSNDNNS